MRKLETETRQAFKTLGDAFGVDNLTPDDWTPELGERMMHAIVKQIQDGGNAALADRYQAAYAASMQTLKGQAKWLVLAQGRTLADEERAQSEAADVAADEASEDFERVQSEG